MSYLVAAYVLTVGCLLAYGLHLARERRRERRVLAQEPARE